MQARGDCTWSARGKAQKRGLAGRPMGKWGGEIREAGGEMRKAGVGRLERSGVES